MIKTQSLLVASLVLCLPVGSAAAACGAADTDEARSTPCLQAASKDAAPPVAADALPAEAASRVEALRVEMRYFKAIGMHKISNERREAIAAIYAEHGVALPKEFKE